MKRKYYILLSVIISFVTITVIFLLLNKNGNKDDISMCIVKFDSLGGSLVESYEFECGNKIEIPKSVPEKEGFEFVEWTYMNQAFDFDKIVDSNVVLVAKYNLINPDSEIVVVQFDSKGGSTINSIELIKGTTISEPINPQKEGFKFIGWYDRSNVKFNFDNAIDDNLILIAKWEEIKDYKPETKKESNSNSNSNSNSDHYTGQLKCVPYIKTDDKPEIVYIGYTGHISYIWNANVFTGYDPVCKVTYSSSDNSVVSIDSDGYIKANKVGNVTLTECVYDKETNQIIGCFDGILTVEEPTNLVVPNSIDCFATFDTLEVGDEAYLGHWYDTAGVDPNYYYVESYVSSDSDVLKIDSDGFYKALKPGTATVTVRTNNGVVGSCQINVIYKKVKSVKIKGNTDNLRVGDTVQLSYEMTPSDASEELIWSVNSNVAEIDSNGKVTTVDVGTAEVRLSNKDQSVQDVIYFEVKKIDVQSISINKTSLQMYVGDSETLAPIVYPSNATNKFVNWSIDRTDVVDFYTNERGEIDVVARFPGTAIITATSDEGQTATCTVTVSEVDVANISLNYNNLNMYKGDSTSLIATISPDNATNKNVSWTSSNSSVASVSSDGNVIANNVGEATITATSENGNKTATCYVVVENRPLTATASIGITTVVSSNYATRGVEVTVNPSGGSGIYNYYYIKIYKDGVLIFETSNTSSNKLFAGGYSNGSYYATFEVHDNQGNEFSGSSNVVTVSGF